MLVANEKLETVQALAGKLPANAGSKGLLSRVVSAVKQAFDEQVGESDPDDMLIGKDASNGSLCVFKDSGGTYRWVARYSNNIRDNDNPPEIISGASHKKFVQLVKAGLVPPPELWLWHVKDWKWGQAEWVAYDETDNGIGFALAGGYIFPEFADLAKQLASLPGVLVSHGMPGWSIERDKSDATVYTQHITAEISPLPDWAAANKVPGFAVLSKESIDMALDKAQKRDLVEQWGVNPNTIDSLEAMNAADAAKAAALGLDTKEVEVEQVEEVAEAPAEQADKQIEEQVQNEEVVEPETQAKAETEQEEEQKSAAVDNTAPLATVLENTMKAVISLSEQVKELSKQVEELKREEGERIAAKAANMPTAALQALMMKSVVGSDEAAVDGRTKLAKSGPEETPAEQYERITPIPIVNQMIAAQRRQQGSV